MNYLGCVGIGQACPFGAKPALLTACPNWQTDYACQDKFFTTYMQRRYSSWNKAKAFWVRTDPRPYPGHWW